MLYETIKPLLFKLPPEKAHDLILTIARLSPALGQLSGTRPNPRLKTKVGSLEWSSPIGLAAGLDKNAEALNFFENQGFGALECGTITLRPQLGNNKPRMFRYPEESSLRNSMGFPNKGLLDLMPRIEAFEGKIPLGANIGKNKESNAEESIEELTLLYDTLAPHANYFVINVSSPNTPGLRAFQEPAYLTELFTELSKYKSIHGKDLYLKIAPDLEEEKVKELIEVAEENHLTGLIATNTTIMPERGAGGMSGVLLKERARKIREIILSQETKLELIGVGGFTNFKDVVDYWSMGGRALQVYTSYIFQGPDLLKNIHKEMVQFLDMQKIRSLEDFLDLPTKEKRERLASIPRNQ